MSVLSKDKAPPSVHARHLDSSEEDGLRLELWRLAGNALMFLIVIYVPHTACNSHLCLIVKDSAAFLLLLLFMAGAQPESSAPASFHHRFI